MLLDKNSQAYFAFELQNPTTGQKTQLTWAVLPQGFKNSPMIFGNQLAKELETCKIIYPERLVLQYVDDILIATETREEYFNLTTNLLNFLGQSDNRFSKKKAQIGKETVMYLGFEITQGQRQLGNERKEAICQMPEPKGAKELQTFLGMAGWCHLWIKGIEGGTPCVRT
ncbi:hypothetical protein FK519_26105 [Klebsiella pneumoniae]|nr:hypothetical protein [Klebsiella pneumoniae]MCQ4187254.1 hypothetical protein [Klebsiella pneumoniae]